MIPYKSLYTEKYDKTDVEKLKKTFGFYLKNIKNISTPKELKMVYDSYVEFYSNTKHTLLNRLNISFLHDIFKIDPATLFFNDLSDSYYLNEDNLNHFYRIWDRDRNKSYSLLQRYSKKIIDYLNSLDYIHDKEVIHVENLYGVKITIIGEEIPVEREQHLVKDIHYDLRNTKDNLKKAITLIKKKGLDKVLSGLKIVLDFRILYTERNIERQGEYSNKSDTINIFGDLFNDNLYTIIHEIGHRFDYKILGKDGQKEWEVFVKSLGDYGITEYSKTNSREMWAEVFTLYVLGRQIPNFLESKFKYFASLK